MRRSVRKLPAGAIALIVLGLTVQLAAAGAPVRGGTLTVAAWQEPDSLNPFLAVQTISRIIRKQTLEGLFDTGPDGKFYAVLAAEVPTVQNGGVSADGRTVRVKLRPELRWQDAHRVTSADLKFTWQAVMDGANPVSSRAGYELIAGIDTPDDLTAVIRFKQLYAPYLTLFSIADALLPRHVFGGTTEMAKAAFNRQPEGTGPFMVSEWVSGSHVLLVRNPNYRRLPNRPYLDQLVFKFVPSREVAIAQIRTGEVDAVWNLIEAQIPEFEKVPGVALQITPSPNLEYLGLNQSAGGDPGKPHPILGDARVRQAIALAINKQVIVDKLLFGKAKVATSPLTIGWASDPSFQPIPYNPNRARQLLSEAGWTPGPDGIRRKAGRRLTLAIVTTTGDKLRISAEQIIAEQLKQVGVDLQIKNVPANVMFGNWEAGGPLKRGTYDIAMDTWGPDADPAGFLRILFHSSQIPTAQNKGVGWNFFRIRNAALDRAIDQADATLDLVKRRALYKEASQQILQSWAYIPLYTRLSVNAFRTSVKGYTGNPWDDFAWDAEDWYVEGQ